MSFDFNYKFWVATKKDLSNIIKRQNVLKKLAPIKNPRVTYKIFSELYILYVELVNKLSYVYSNTFQVQKREVVRPLVEAAQKRLLELKNELKNLELSEYVYSDKALIARKLTPYDLVIWRSPQFLYRRPHDIQNLIYENKIFMNEEEKEELNVKEHISITNAVILIQAHERARSARVYLAAIKYDKKFLKLHKRNKVEYTFTHKPDQPMSIPVKRTIFNANFIKPTEYCINYFEAKPMERNSAEELVILENEKSRLNAVLKIQRAWRKYKGKKVEKKKLIQKHTLYNMKNKRRLVKPNQYSDSIVETYKKEMLKKKLDEEFVQLISNERVRLLQQRTPWIMEDISDHIRGWFHEFYEKTERFHPYPDEIQSGTILVLLDETMTPEEFKENMNAKSLSKEEKKKEAEKAKEAKKKQKEKLRKEKLKEAKRKKKMKSAGICDIADNIKSNKNIEIMEKTLTQYSIDWRHIDEYLNKNHDPIKEWVTEGELAIIHRELRVIVDEFMRIEHELLERANCADLRKKYKPPKKRKQRKKKGKKKKKKRQRDTTADRTVESLYEELKEAGIIEKYKNQSFDDLIAEFNFTADDTRDENFFTTIGPAKGDIKMLIQESMLGMGEFTVEKPKSVLIIGPFRNGKKLLCNIVASELDAVFMNLSPEKTKQYADRLSYLINIVMKVARAFQPTILFINDAHRVYWKKIPKDQEELNPRLLAKAIQKKILKPIKKDDKIMLLGTSDSPWTANPKFKKAFQRIILIPQSDYGTSFLLWLELLERHLGDDNVEDYAISTLAKVLQGYPSGVVAENMASVLNIKRKMHIRTEGIDPREFLEYFYKDENAPVFPPDVKILEKFDNWYSKSNKLAKARKKIQGDINKRNEKAKAKAGPLQKK